MGDLIKRFAIGLFIGVAVTAIIIITSADKPEVDERPEIEVIKRSHDVELSKAGRRYSEDPFWLRTDIKELQEDKSKYDMDAIVLLIENNCGNIKAIKDEVSQNNSVIETLKKHIKAIEEPKDDCSEAFSFSGTLDTFDCIDGGSVIFSNTDLETIMRVEGFPLNGGDKPEYPLRSTVMKPDSVEQDGDSWIFEWNEKELDKKND